MVRTRSMAKRVENAAKRFVGAAAATIAGKAGQKVVNTLGSGRRTSLSGSNRPVRFNLQRSDAVNARTTVEKRRGKKIKLKKQPKVKVGRKFRAKVKKALIGPDNYGYFQQVYGEQQMIFTEFTGAQHVFPANVATRSPAVTPIIKGSLFHPAQVMHVASRLWNEKAAKEYPLIGDTGNFDNDTFNVEVLKQWVVFRLRNNGKRIAYGSFYKCQPLRNGIGTGGFLDIWRDACTEMQARGELLGTPTVDINTLHTDPRFLSQFKVKYKTVREDFVLEPGKEIILTVAGPQMIYDFKKLWYADGTSNQFHNTLKQDIHAGFVFYNDLITNVNEGVYQDGRWSQTNTQNLSHHIICETSYHCRLKCPQQAGFVPAVSPASQPLNQQRFK